MAKRRLSEQQKNRIQAAQLEVSESAEHQHGIVVSHQGGRILVELESGNTIDCKIKSNLGNIVCGDRVAIETTSNQEHRVLAILARDNLLQRIDGFGQVRAVAANISQLFVCLAVTPEPNLYLLDQYLLSAEQQHIEACILLNKIDLLTDTSDPFAIASTYTPLGYKMIATSVKTGQGMDEFTTLLTDQVSVLSGVSGVGKSSLTKWLLPGTDIKIASISEANEEGRHTTRASRLYHLPAGGDLIDTPGIRGFNPFVDNDRPLAHGFREISAFAENCHFHNCLHLNEPDCAVIKALAQGKIAESRYLHYVKMREQVSAG
ncbi:MAG: ribosome small subunit-dependent GTPase A [Gammaproteobacteria bacterium]|nr:ribosome small subunit-dependent GTPase A [Gammaproteobacteria bacterium]MDH3858994.1 ribosome small subunit-dependent GTPase A [Gammaproteobacteria bacterium]